MKREGRVRRLAGPPNRAHELPVWIELENRVAPGTCRPAVSRFRISNPDVTRLVHEDGMREHEHASPECAQKVASRIKLHNRVEQAALAAVGATTIRDPDMAMGVHRHCTG